MQTFSADIFLVARQVLRSRTTLAAVVNRTLILFLTAGSLALGFPSIVLSHSVGYEHFHREFGVKDRERYLEELENIGGCCTAIAMSRNGCWGKGAVYEGGTFEKDLRKGMAGGVFKWSNSDIELNISRAKQSAIQRCDLCLDTAESADRCVVTDVNGTSQLIGASDNVLPPCPSSGVFHNCFGTYIDDDNKYVGEWKGGKIHGRGTFTFITGYSGVPAGLQYIGEILNEAPWNAVVYSASGEEMGTWENGEWCPGCKPTAKHLTLIREIELGQTVLKTETASNSSIHGWCVTNDSIFTTTNASCDTKGGRWKSTYSAAQAEHLRLKNQSSVGATTTSNSSTQGYCAKASGLSPSTIFDCNTENGTWVPTYDAAKSEHLRLKNEHLRLKNESPAVPITTEVVKSKPESQPSQTVAEAKSALELEFWKSIKESKDPDMFREYLRQFPSGTYAGLAKIKIQKLSGPATSVAEPSVPDLNYGEYHALVIGNNDYRHLTDLRSAVNDARDVAHLLENDYGFNVTKIENASRSEIVQSISKLRREVDSQDNVLIYYAGHGWLDKEVDEGYWLPVDARQDDPSNWLMTERIVSQVRGMKAKHVMIVADSCFSGTLTRGIKFEPRTPQWLTKMVKKKTRISITSGGLEPVTDGGGGNNSVFAAAFLSVLKENDGVLDSSKLFNQLRAKVMANSDQTPRYGDIHKAGHDGGDFLFVRQ